MNNLLKFLSRSSGGGGSSAVTLLPKSAMGVNISGYYYADNLGDMTVNALKEGEGWYNSDGSTLLGNGDAAGWPTADLGVILHRSRAHDDVRYGYGRFTGWADAIGIGWSADTIDSINYDSGSNVTTFRHLNSATEGAANRLLQLTGTRRTGGATGTINTGVTDLVLTHPGYTLTDIDAGKIWTDEYLAYNAPFRSSRMMDAMNINSNWFTTWDSLWKASNSHVNGLNLDDMIALTNTNKSDLWLCVPIEFSYDDIALMVAYVEARVTGGQVVRWEPAGNETWNYNGADLNGVVQKVIATELKGFTGHLTSRGRGYVASRTGGVVSIETQAPHLWTNGQNIQTTLGIARAEVPVTVVDATHATFTDGGPDMAANTGDSNTYVIGVTTSDLLPVGGDPFEFYHIGTMRWSMRRACQASTVIRSIVGDAKMHTQHKVIFADQVGYGNGADTGPFVYARNLFPDHLPSYYITEWAMAPYIGSSLTSTPGVSLDDFVIAYAASATASALAYPFELRAHRARRWGVKSVTYEGGIETQYDDGSDADKVIRNQAKFDPRVRVPIRDYLAAFFRTGNEMFHWFNDGLMSPNSNSAYTWGFTDGYTNFNAPVYQAIREVQAMDIYVERNLVPGTIAGGAYANHYTDDFEPFYTFNTYDKVESERYIIGYPIYATESGAYTVRIKYRYLVGGTYPDSLTFDVDLDGVRIGNLPFTQIDRANLYWTASLSIPSMSTGFHSLDVCPTGGQIGEIAIDSVEVLRA